MDLEVLRAKVDCEVTATANLIVEALRATNINFELDVHAHGEIEVDFGITKGTISRRFDEKMNMDFVMGSDTEAPWDRCRLHAPEPPTLITPSHEPLVWIFW